MRLCKDCKYSETTNTGFASLLRCNSHEANIRTCPVTGDREHTLSECIEIRRDPFTACGIDGKLFTAKEQ